MDNLLDQLFPGYPFAPDSVRCYKSSELCHVQGLCVVRWRVEGARTAANLLVHAQDMHSVQDVCQAVHSQQGHDYTTDAPGISGSLRTDKH